MTPRSIAMPPGAATDPQLGRFIEHQVGHLLRRAYALARRNSAASLASLGDISPVQASVLATLLDGAVTQAELGRRIGMESANTHTLIKRMLAMDLIQTRPDATNRRLSVVEHSAEGRRIALQLETALAAAANATLAALTVGERGSLIALLQRLIEHGSPQPGIDNDKS